MTRLFLLRFILVLTFLLAITLLPGMVESKSLDKIQLTILDSDRQTVVASGPSGAVGRINFGDVRESSSTSHLIFVGNTGSKGYWIVQTVDTSSLSASRLPPDSVLSWNLTHSFRLDKNSTPLPVLLTLKVGPTIGEFDFQIQISAQKNSKWEKQTPSPTRVCFFRRI